MSYSPTIIAASLDDAELRKSIDKLVNHVDDQLHYMVASTKVNVKSINDALKTIGDIDTKLGSKGSKDGGAAKQIKAQEELAESVKKTTSEIKKQGKEQELSFDQTERAKQQAIKSARESYLAFVQGFKAQGEAIARQIKDAEAALNKAVENRVNELNTKLANAKTKLNELNTELAKQRMNAERTGNYSTYNAGITRTTQAIEYQMKHIVELQKKISEVSPNMFTQQVQDISALRKEQERVANIMKEDVTTRQQSTNATQQQLSAEQKVTDEIHRQAQAIRESQQWKEKGFVTVNGRDVYNLEGSDTPLKNRIPLEEQLLRLQELEKATSKEITEEGAKRLTQEQLELAITGSTKETLQKSRDILRAMVETRQATATFTAQLESANRLNEKLKELRTRYNEMTFGQRMSAEGQEIAQNIRIVTRETQKLQAQLARPSSLKEALGLPAKNLDDISYKIRQLQSYMRGLDQTNIKSATEIRTVSAAIEELRKRENDLLGKQTQLFGSNNALANSWRYMRNRLAFYFTVGAGTSFIKQMVDVRSQYEMNERALGILINSAERGTKIFNELSQMALVSPYTLIELSAAAKQLTAYDIAAKDVVDTTRRLADMAAAVGVPIERLTYALGQIKAYGYLNSRDARMFANAGIPLVKQLADYYTELEGRIVSTADVYDRIKKKQVSFEDSVNVIKKMTDEGGKFFDFQAKMAETLKVQLANLNLAWNNMLNDMGEETQGTLVFSIGTLKQMFLHWKDIEHILFEVVAAFGAYKAAQVVSIALTGTFTKALNGNILAQKRSIASSLQKKALTQTLTAEEKRLVATQNLVTASDYRMALSSKGLTKQQALFLVATNRRNIALMRALIQMNMLTAAEVRNMTTGKALAIVWNLIALRIKSAATAIKSFVSSNWIFLVLGSIYEIYHAWDGYSEHVAEVNRSAAEHAKEALKSIRDYLNNDLTQQTVKKAASGSLSNEEGIKTWNAMREKIEEVSSASSTYLTQLFKTEDVSKRITLGAQYLQDIDKARSIMSEIEEDAITLSQTSWGGLLGEGIKDDLKDYESAIDDFAKVDSDITQQSSKRWYDYWKERKEQQEEFANEVKKTTDDIYDVASKGGLSVNAQRELFEQALSERAQKEQLSVRGTRLLRIQAEKEYYNYAKTMLEERMQYEEGAQKQRTQNEIAALEAQFNSNKALQESFFAWLSDRHNNEVSKRLGHLTTEEIKTGKWLKGENLKWVKERAQDFTREYGLSFDTLYGYVKKANTWEIHIKTFFDTIGQPLTDVQKDYETRTGKKFKDNPLLKDATSQLDIVKKLQDEESRLAEEYKASETAGGAYFVTNKVRMESELNSLREQIHQYNALTKAEEKEQNARNKKGGSGSKKDLLGEAVQKNVQYINEIRKAYEEFKKDGLNATDAVEAATSHFGKSLARNNKELAKYGIQGLTGEQFATMNLQQVRDYFQNMINGAQGSAKAVEILEKEVKNIDAELIKFNQKAIADSLNNELSKLKDEYELAVAIDADPELGNVFADMMGINTETLPHTVKEYADEYTTYLNKFLAANKSDLQFGEGELFGLTYDDIAAFQKQFEEGTLNEVWFKEIKKAFDDISGMRKKDLEDTEKWKNSLIEKYGGLQAKLTKIFKDDLQNQINTVKTFGTEQQKSDAVRLRLMVDATDDPARLAEINAQIATIVKNITDNNPVALKLVQASSNEAGKETSKAYWEDFKDSDLYTMTFEDMANNSTRAIKVIIGQLDELKNKVKEDPASMKALIKSLEDAENELITRNPFKGVVSSLKEWKNAAKETKDAQARLAIANAGVAKAQEDVDATAEGTKERLEAEQKLNIAMGVQKTALNDVLNAENKQTKAQSKLKKSLTALKEANEGVSNTFSAVSQMFRAWGDDDTADTIDAINEGFTVMSSVISAVIVVMEVLKTSNVWLLAISAALGVIVGLVSFLGGQNNKRITKKVEESELAVRRLENAYKELSYAVERAYGMATIGAQQAAKANKELQLVELKRQLSLEESRDAKDRDEDKILDLKGRILDLAQEIEEQTDSIVNSLLGISSVGDAMENLMGGFIEALRSGENAMDVFNDSVDDMIANMVKKMFVSKILQPWFEQQWDAIQKELDARAGDLPQEIAELQTKITNAKNADVDNRDALVGALRSLGGYNESQLFDMYHTGGEGIWWGSADRLREEYKKALARAEERADELNQELANATAVSADDINRYAELLRSGEPVMDSNMQTIQALLEELGLINKETDSNLSALQQGISGITEDTAGAIESYLNGVSQQVYYHSSLLEQIRDSVVGLDLDVSLGVQSQMLLQLQSSYQIQMSIRDTLQGWTNASGMAVRVEMI